MAQLAVFTRSSLFSLAVIVITPPYALLALLVIPLPARVRYRIVTSWSHIVIALARVICGIRYRVRGKVHSRGGPYIVLAKHQSAWETLAFQVLFPPQVLVLKRGLLWVPFFGWGLATLSPITVKRGAGSKTLRRLLEQGRDRLRRGFWVVIFPEGTRVPPGKRVRFQPGGAWLACRTDVPVIPVAHNAGALWPKNGFLKYPGIVTVSIGAPIHAAGRKPDELNREVEDWIEHEVARIGHPRTVQTARTIHTIRMTVAQTDDYCATESPSRLHERKRGTRKPGNIRFRPRGPAAIVESTYRRRRESRCNAFSLD